jgi:hypothetical protein
MLEITALEFLMKTPKDVVSIIWCMELLQGPTAIAVKGFQL